jgi:hypothetical protein
MKRSFSTMNDQEDNEANKRIKIATSDGTARQWFEVDDLLGILINLIFADIKLLLNLAGTSKA